MKEALFTILFAGSAIAADSHLTTMSRMDADMEYIDERIFVQCDNSGFRSDLSGLLDLELYTIDQQPPGLLFTANDELFNPRLSSYLDTHWGKHFYSLV